MEPLKISIAIPVAEETQIAAARRSAAEFCRRLDLSESTIARAELIAVELAGNILHHAQRGKMYLSPVPGNRKAVEIFAADNGPGVGDLTLAMQDGFTTHTTLGLGLGAVRRQADSLDVYSRYSAGTVVVAQVREFQEPADETETELTRTAVLSTCIDGETLNGDTWAVYEQDDRRIFLLVDGLGHGYYASQAAAMAVSIADGALHSEPALPLSAIIQRMHLPMQSTRGAAVLLVSKERSSDRVLCCGVGNLAAVLCGSDGRSRSLVSHNGTVGHRMARVQDFEYRWDPGDLLVMHSDGVSARWKLTQYPGLFGCSPAAVAGVLYRDCVRGRDDATVLVSRLSREQEPGERAHG